MLTVENIKQVVSSSEFEFFGIRIDSGIRYNVGDIANNSHQLFQDPDYDEGGELIYPYIEEGMYKGYYDAGELEGTCAIRFDAEDDESIRKAIGRINMYCGNYIHVLGSDYAEGGNDNGEIILNSAEVMAVYEK